MPEFEITPKALANFSPGFERSVNPGVTIKRELLKPERVRQLANLPAYGRLRLPGGVFSGVTFSVFFSSARIALASAFIGFESGATSTNFCR